MKKLFPILLALSLLMSLTCCSGRKTDMEVRRAAVLHSDSGDMALFGIENDEKDSIELYSPQVFVYDADSEKYLYLRGVEKILYPASTTKLLTALYALELLSPDALITPGDELSLKNEQSAIAFVNKNHTLTAEMLIEGMLLPSGGDAAYALAAAAGRVLVGENASGKAAVEAFISGMNEYAVSLGLCGSNFTSPDGFYDEENYSTLEDMTLLAIKATENDIIMKYTSMARDEVIYASGHSNTWINTNRMLHEDDEYYSPYVTGLKTGTLEGNSCLICSFTIDGRDYIAGVFSETDKEHRYIDMKRIIDFCEKR